MKRLYLFFSFLILLCCICFLAAPVLAAGISGTVITEGGGNGTDGYVYVFEGDPCDNRNRSTASGEISMVDLTFSIEGIPAGEYFIRASISNSGLVSEWWAGEESTQDCSKAQAISLLEDETVSGMNFELGRGASLTGKVYGRDGVLLEGGGIVELYKGAPCGVQEEYHINLALKDGVYRGEDHIPAGEYYLKTNTDGQYVDEWWAEPESTQDCEQAQTITISNGEDITDKDFHLNVIGSKITGVFFDTEGGYVLESGVSAYIGDPCDHPRRVKSLSYLDDGPSIPAGSYTLEGLPAEEIFLKVSGYYHFADTYAHFVSAWWTGNGKSSPSCSQAEPFTMKAGETVAGIDFHLVRGTTILGHIFDGTDPASFLPGLKQSKVAIYSGSPCGKNTFIQDGYVWGGGNYAIRALPAGTYFLKASSPGGYRDEWWAKEKSSPECSGAELLTVGIGEKILNIDFQLDGSTFSPGVNKLLLGGKK